MPKSKMGVKKGLMDRKKNAVVREYRKFQKKKGSYTRNQEDQSHGNEHEEEKLPFFRRALQEYEAKKKQKEREMQLRHAKRKEREEALRKYTEKKRQNFKKLSQKT
ncbi:hypothetical protein X975_24124, partial [Stegodyphus mimosarum]